MATSGAKSVVRFEHVTVSFDGVRALDDVSFEVCEGETRIILGAASSGKTVLLKTALAWRARIQERFIYSAKVSRA